MNKYFIHERNRNDNKYTQGLEKFIISESEFNDNDIIRICDIYWMDYICFPFDIPIQCDLKDLIKKHYYKHVEYKPCY